MNALQPMTDQADPGTPSFSRVLQRGWWLILLITLLSVAAAILVSSMEPKSYLSEAQMVLVQRPISAPSRSPGDTIAVTQVAPEIETVDTQMGMLQSTGMYQHTMDWLKNDALAKGQSTTGFDDMSPKQFAHDVEVVNPRNSNLLVVDAEANDPQKAAVLANAVVQAFSQWKRELASRDLMDSTRRIADQTRQYQAKLTKAEEQKTAYNEAHNIVDVTAEAKTAFDLVEARHQDAAGAQQDYNAQKARLSELASQLRQANLDIKNSAGGRNDVLVQQLQTQLAQLEIQRSATAKRYTKNFPGQLEPFDAQIRDIKAKLAQAVQSTVGASGGQSSLQSESALVDQYKGQQALTAFSAARLEATATLLQQAQDKMAGLPAEQMEENRLGRKVDLATTQYQDMQTALDAARLDLQRVSGDIQVTQSAYLPDRPYKPNWALNVALGLLLGLLLSFGITVLRDGMDRRVHGMEDVRRLIAGPIVATLPRLSRRMLTSSAEGESIPQIADSFRVARVNLTLRMHKMARKLVAPQQVILVTSAAPGEGKSLTAANLARSFAEGGGHVILVDANLTNPSQDRYFPQGAQVGLADVLAGQADLRDVLTPAEGGRLSVLHAGAPVASGTNLLLQPKLRDVIHALRQQAVTIIIDGPDCASGADALLLAAQADVLMQVIGVNKVEEDILLDTAVALESTGKPLVFFVNRAETQKRRSSQITSGAMLSAFQSLHVTGVYQALPETRERTDHGTGNGNGSGSASPKEIVWVHPPSEANKD